MSDQLDIVVTSMDVGATEAAKRLAQAFDLSVLEAEQFVRELPRVAKRNATREEAARYVEALKAIGARVETLASEAPRPTLRARIASGASDQLMIGSPADSEPAMRFRATGNLGMISMPPKEDLHPSIPKAPRIPHDLNRMPNGGELPMPSIRPPAMDDNDGSEPRRHTDAQLPPPLVMAARQMAREASLTPTPAPTPTPALAPTVPSNKPAERTAPAPPPSNHDAETERVAAGPTRGTGKALAVAIALGVLVFLLVRLFR